MPRRTASPRRQPIPKRRRNCNFWNNCARDLEEAKDRVLRSQAELDNYRKRAAREVEEHRRFANLPLIRDLLPVVDNLERAISAAEKTHDLASLLAGIKLGGRLFEEALKRHHCVRIPALHQPFDPNLHQAISQQPSDDFPPNTVILESQPGFQLHERRLCGPAR